MKLTQETMVELLEKEEYRTIAEKELTELQNSTFTSTEQRATIFFYNFKMAIEDVFAINNEAVVKNELKELERALSRQLKINRANPNFNENQALRMSAEHINIVEMGLLLERMLRPTSSEQQKIQNVDNSNSNNTLIFSKSEPKSAPISDVDKKSEIQKDAVEAMLNLPTQQEIQENAESFGIPLSLSEVPSGDVRIENGNDKKRVKK
jgi:hypothetical protein